MLVSKQLQLNGDLLILLPGYSDNAIEFSAVSALLYNCGVYR